MSNQIKFPFYAKLAFTLVSLTIILIFIYVAHQALIPVLLSMLFAILLRPLVNFYHKRLKFPHVIAVLISVVLFISVIVGILFFVSWKITDMANDWDQIKNNLNIHYHNIQRWVQQTFHISYREQEKYIQEAGKNSLTGGPAMVGRSLSSVTDVLLNLVLVPIYTFLFLLYRNLFLKFLSMLFKDYRSELQEILSEIKSAVQNYLVGLMIELAIVSTLTSVGLMIIGVNYAVLLGVITGVLNLIPYIGILIAGGLSIVATLTTSTELSTAFGVIAVNAVVQLIDNNILVPMIVSSKVKINAFVSIFAIIIAGSLGGVAGMFLAIPLIAIMKVVFDRVEELKPWGYLMGDDLPKTYEFKKIKLPEFDAGQGDADAAPTNGPAKKD